MKRVPDDVTLKFYNDRVISPEPFIAVSNIIRMLRSMEVVDQEYYYAKMDSFAKNCINLFEQFFFMPEHMVKAKLIHIDKDLMPSILNTDNEIFYRNTALPVMFINQDFHYKDYLIKGILIANTKELAEHMYPNDLLDIMINNPGAIEKMNSIMVMITFVDTSLPIPEENFLAYSLTGEMYGVDWKGDTYDKALRNFTSIIVCNILDFMNHDTETIELNTILIDRVSNEKRIKRGKAPMPTKVYIRPKSEFRNYYVSFNADLDTRHFSHRFLVRGHWRHYRSDRFVNMSGKSVWIKPQMRGRGIFIEKKYELEGGNDDE
jgi:hypothetical protein